MLDLKCCVICNQEFRPGASNHILCSFECRKLHRLRKFPSTNPLNIPRGTIGAIAELVIAAHFMDLGYDVFRAVSMHCFCDLVVVKNDVSQTVEVRTARRNATGNGLQFGKVSRKHAVDLYALYVPDSKEVIIKPASEVKLTPLN